MEHGRIRAGSLSPTPPSPELNVKVTPIAPKKEVNNDRARSRVSLPSWANELHTVCAKDGGTVCSSSPISSFNECYSQWKKCDEP